MEFFLNLTFISENVKIHYKSNEIANSKNIRVSIITKNLFSINNVTIKDLVFKETDFKLNFQILICLSI